MPKTETDSSFLSGGWRARFAQLVDQDEVLKKKQEELEKAKLTRRNQDFRLCSFQDSVLKPLPDLTRSKRDSSLVSDTNDESEYTWTDCSEDEEDEEEKENRREDEGRSVKSDVKIDEKKASKEEDHPTPVGGQMMLHEAPAPPNCTLNDSRRPDLDLLGRHKNGARNATTMGEGDYQALKTQSEVKACKENIRKCNEDCNCARVKAVKSSANDIAMGPSDLKFKSKPVSYKKDLSWLEHREENVVIDSMFTTLEKWLITVKQWSNEPLSGLKARASSSVLVGTRPTDPYPRLRDEIFSYKGEANFFGKPHGRGVVTFENGDTLTGEFRNNMREGPATLKLVSGNMVFLEGTYVNDKLDGNGKIEYKSGDILYASFNNGTLHGLGKLFDKDRNIQHIGWYSNGKLSGTVWKFLVGGGCIVGDVDVMGNMIGTNIAYLFPDNQTALFGTFVREHMAMAQICFIQLVSIRNEICHLKFTQPRGPIYMSDGGTSTIICKEPLLPDPYESQHCYVRSSKIKGAQEGLFAKKAMAKDTIVCFYNGIRMRCKDIEDDKYDHEKNAYKIIDLLGVDPEDGDEGVLDIPEEFVSLRKYQASLAHKANHSFNPNGKFVLFEHPRFGKVPSIITIKDVEKDSEITVSYDYAMEEAPPWYQELFAMRIMDQYKETKATWNF